MLSQLPMLASHNRPWAKKHSAKDQFGPVAARDIEQSMITTTILPIHKNVLAQPTSMPSLDGQSPFEPMALLMV
jgi:hypothetical protein